MGLVLYLFALAAGPLSSVVYWLGFSWRGPSLAKTWVKAMPMGILFAWLMVFEADVGDSPLPFAVLAAWIGDVLLSRPGQRSFLFGLLAFALAHIALIGVFLDRGVVWEAMRWPGAVALLFFAVGFAAVLAPRAGQLRWPVLGYIFVIAAMALTGLAISSGDARTDEAIVLAVSLFVLSDALIGVQRFLLPSASRWQAPVSLAIWPTYYVAMVLFAAAAVG